jgi:twitching motility two-component system response regulator PilG
MAQAEAVALLRQGIDAARTGDKVRTRELLRQATTLDPGNELAWLWRASSAEQPDEAVDCLRRVLQVNPLNEKAREALPDALVRAAATVAAADRSRAKVLLVEATTLTPRHEAAWLWRASLADTADEGLRHLKTVLSINPNNEKALAGVAKLQSQVAPRWRCPICTHAADATQSPCGGCGCLTALDDLKAFDAPRTVNRPAVEAAAKALYAAAREQPTADAVFALGLAYLNLGFPDEAMQTLQSAGRMKDLDAARRAQVTKLFQHRERAAVAAPQPSTTKPMVMVVDDSPTVRKLVSVTLTAAGYRILEAESGYGAADLIRDHGTPALFILDVNMPGMDGFTLCKTLRDNQETSKVPVVFLTGKDGFLNKLRGQWAGASDYLTKPFEPQKLLATVGKLIPAAKAKQSAERL